MVSNIVLSAAAWASSLRATFVESLKQESGQDLIEYAVLAGAIAIVGGAAMLAIGPDIFTTFANEVKGCITFDKATCTTPAAP